MPSITFQPLLFDALKYNLPNTTYQDHFRQKKRKQFTNTSKFNTLSQRQKMDFLMKYERPFNITKINSSNTINTGSKKSTKNFKNVRKIICLNSFIPLSSRLSFFFMHVLHT